MCKHIQKLCFIAAVTATVIVTGACDKKTGDSGKEVTYRLKWLFNASVAGDIYADVNGFFAEQGLDVTIKPGGPERDAIKELELGRSQFGTASADQVIRAVSKGASVVVIAQLFQTNSLQWIYRPDKTRVDTPEDLRGKTIGITYGGNDEAIMRAVLAKYNIMENEVQLFSVHYDYTPFYEGKVDIWPVYRNTQGIFISEKLSEAAERTAFFDPDMAGVRFVANSVITTEQMIKEDPQTVRKFVTALLRGWQKSLDPKNEEKAVAAIHQFDKDTSIETVRKQLSVTKRFIKPSPETEIGKIDADAWKQTENIMLEQNLIPGPVNVEKILKPFYNL
ncbi:ABC transporter substrate-binding protein [Desulfonema magnum]|uniref:Thiamine pyrimidine synthase n=1 Tax=Desulfonema magnum TaxID=45655 RepID=A0A975GRS6_9BACT|nr:ABC transporter substrate-binding protein [Desulfonema magnum]QTA91334.1 NMT1/THI5 like domain-containing protein [Desulfonema magnum]